MRNSETAPLHASMRRAVEHRGLMAIAIGDLGVANSTTVALAALDRGWTLYAHTAAAWHRARRNLRRRVTRRAGLEGARRCCTGTRSPTATCAARRSPSTDGTALFGGFGSAEYGATDVLLQADIAALLVTTTAIFGAEAAVRAAIEEFDEGHRPQRLPPADEIRSAQTHPRVGRSIRAP